jgi:hypothetical protein
MRTLGCEDTGKHRQKQAQSGREGRAREHRSQGTKAIFRKFLKRKVPQGLERAAKAYAMIFPEISMPTPEGVKTLLDDMAPRNPKAKTAEPKQFVDMSFVQELQASDFIKRLYAKQTTSDSHHRREGQRMCP